MLSPVEADTYMLLGANGYCYGNFPEGWRGDYDQFKTDWQQNGAHLGESWSFSCQDPE